MTREETIYYLQSSGFSEEQIKTIVSALEEERDKAFIKAVVDDDWKAVQKYSKKYGVPVPKERNVMKAGIYKAVQYCTNIPEDVKVLAMQKCLQLGFSPLIKPYEP